MNASGTKQAIQGTVKNDINGTGWTDVEGKEGKADIAINTEGQTLDDYKMVQFLKKKGSVHGQDCPYSKFT